ncbi:hypothetical protein N0V84_006414 [Fusarium piperis]|uniref:Uncharacterized protein n=1 Tax=Fusarium piperis TaxID=1435070 RepID=A0A9W8WBZ2_9HYPO|nr:hypothetical protein N0V84_006414 [Fusarium piperis]
MEQALYVQPTQDVGVTEEVDRQVDNLGSLAPVHSEEAIFIDRRHLWSSFFGYSLSIERRLERHLVILHALQEASPSRSAITDASQGNIFTQFLHSRFRWFRAPSAAKYHVSRPDRLMLKINKDVAVSNLNHMIDLLEIAKMLPKPTKPLFSPPVALWQGAVLGAMKLVEPLAWDLFLDYNLNCLHKELEGLKREFVNGTIGEKNRGAMDSWHMNARSLIR